ncbi:hypothetical protein HDU67_007086 [Dinochytrium kinnereticum]|nr:hypothetical protein HDU67_007086 [Dinochytrium kinnereticum]
MLEPSDLRESAFLDGVSYCNPNSEMGQSPSLCGRRGIIIRNIRLGIAGMLLLASIASFVPWISLSPSKSQSVLMVSQTLRGLGYTALFYVIINWSQLDGSSILMNAVLINSIFISIGPCMLQMEKFYIESLFLFLGAVAGKLIGVKGGAYLFTFLLTAIPCGAAYNVSMERNQQRYFVLGETAEWFAGDVMKATQLKV